ncbi:hypothetical protein DCO46_14610 [Flavobacterium sp. HTF]|nr:hypothetical protein DCO46_14610 [Flavobacterium sp. HTF]
MNFERFLLLGWQNYKTGSSVFFSTVASVLLKNCDNFFTFYFKGRGFASCFIFAEIPFSQNEGRYFFSTFVAYEKSFPTLRFYPKGQL